MKSAEAKHYLLDAVLREEKISSPDAFPFSLPVIRHLKTLTFHPAVTFFVGENGSGKSTLLEALAIGMGFNAEGGSRNFNFSTRASHSDLHEALRLGKGVRRRRDGFFLRAESFFNVASQIDDLGVTEFYGDKSLHEQSHGESFFALLMYRFSGNGLYILDEPEAALSPSRQMAMISRMHDLVNKNSQFIIATHSPILMAYPDADIFQLGEKGLVKTAYKETEHYRITKNFLNHPDSSLKILLDEEK